MKEVFRVVTAVCCNYGCSTIIDFEIGAVLVDALGPVYLALLHDKQQLILSSLAFADLGCAITW